MGFGTSISRQRNNDNINWIHLALDSTVHAFRQFVIGLIDCVQFRNRPERADEPIQLKGIYANIIMPIGAVGIFMLLYGGINEAFDASTDVMFEWIGWFFTMEYIGIDVATWYPVLGALILAVLIPTFTNPYTEPSIWLTKWMIRIPTSWHSLLITKNQKGHLKEIDIATVTPTLMVLNILVWFHVVDLTTIISSDLSNAAVLSQNVHACLSRVLLATVASIGILMIPSNDQENSRHRYRQSMDCKQWCVLDLGDC